MGNKVVKTYVLKNGKKTLVEANQAAEDDITNPQQYIKKLLCDEYDTTKAFYDELSADEQT